MTSAAGGRPTSLDAIVLTRDGRPVTAEERIIELMSLGTHVDTAAASIGIVRNTLHDWLRTGARARTRILEGKAGHPDDLDAEKPPPDDKSLRCMRFADAVDAATNEWLANQEALLTRVTRPSKRTTTTQTTDAAGNIVTTTTRTEEVPPDMATARWRLERHPASRHLYRPAPAQLEHSGPDGDPIPVETRAADLLDKIRTARTMEDTENA